LRRRLRSTCESDRAYETEHPPHGSRFNASRGSSQARARRTLMPCSTGAAAVARTLAQRVALEERPDFFAGIDVHVDAAGDLFGDRAGYARPVMPPAGDEIEIHLRVVGAARLHDAIRTRLRRAAGFREIRARARVGAMITLHEILPRLWNAERIADAFAVG